MKRTAWAILCCVTLVSSAAGEGKPREAPPSHRQVLGERLLRDMTDTHKKGIHHAFTDEDRRRAMAVNDPDEIKSLNISDKDAERLYEYYLRVRRRVNDDVAEINNRATNGEPTDSDVEKWERDRTELATLGAELAAEGNPLKRLSELVYASAPGYSLREYNTLPEMYYRFNEGSGALEYLGPSDTVPDDMSAQSIMEDSPLYLMWVAVHHDRYERWSQSHRDRYDRIVAKEPRISEAVRAPTSSRSGGNYRPAAPASHTSTGTTSHGSAGSWGKAPVRAPAVIHRPVEPTVPRTGSRTITK